MGLLNKLKSTGLAVKKGVSSLAGRFKGSKINPRGANVQKKSGIVSKVGTSLVARSVLRTGGAGIKVATKLGSLALRAAGASALGTAGVVAASAYVAEQAAEKLGVRGGAGFFGKRRKKSRRRYATIRVPRNVRGQGRLTASEESRLRSLARSYAYSEGSTRRRKHRSHRSKYRSAAWMAKIRKMRK